MSEIEKTYSQHSVYNGIAVDIAEESLNRVTKLLAGINGGVYKAVGSALKRAGDSGNTEVKRAVTKEYTVNQSEFLKNLHNINHFTRESGGSISVVFGIRGYVIPLLRFNTKVGQDGLVTAQVKRSGAGEILEHVFVAQMGGHRGVYERIGPDRFPVKELYGPASTQMIYANESVSDAWENKTAETFSKRIEHEIEALLNGWRN